MFSLSYLLRVVFDIMIGFSETDTPFRNYMCGSFVVIPFDIVPIYVVLLFHRRNLRSITHSKDTLV